MSDTTESTAQAKQSQWLLLIHRVPPKPDYLRVKVRRHLTRIGAVPLKSSVYVLPLSDESLEDFEWLRREIVAEGGEATICEAAFVAGITNQELMAMFESDPRAAGQPAPPAGLDTVQPGRTWVTRRGIKVDRMASAWLISRFIDPRASFRFVDPTGHQPDPGELRFDMYEGEYGHESGRCTFETLLARFGLTSPALGTLGQIVHDLDCKDERFSRPQAAGVAALIEGIVAGNESDEARLARGTLLFDDLHAGLSRA